MENFTTSAYKTIVQIILLFILILWETASPYFHFFKKTNRTQHALKNIFLGAINGFFVSVFFVGLWSFSAILSEKQQVGLSYLFSLSPFTHLIIAVLVLDFWTYWWHRMNHEIRFFWKFHKVHHSDQTMDVTTAFRFHLGEIFFSSLFRVPIIYLVGIQIWQLILYEFIMFSCVQFHHANIGLPKKIDRFLRIFIVTPEMHKLHHSRIPQDFNSNYTSLLSIWDRLFKTFRRDKHPEKIKFGVKELDNHKFQSFLGLLKSPFYKTPD